MVKLLEEYKLLEKAEKVARLAVKLRVFHSEIFLQDIESSRSSEENVMKTTELGEKDDDDLIPTSNIKSGVQLIEDNIVKAPDKSDDLVSISGYLNYSC